MTRIGVNLVGVLALASLVGVTIYGVQLLLVELMRCHGELVTLSARAAGL